MSAVPLAVSALQQAGFSDFEFQRSRLRVREVRNASLMRLHALVRDDFADESARAVTELGTELGTALPARVGQTSGTDPLVMCLRPAEWLVFSETASVAERLEWLRLSRATDRLVALDFSDGLATIRISGAAAPWLLAKLSGLDFIGAQDAGPHCARTRLGQVAVIVNFHAADRASSHFVYDLIFDRSIARYVWELLQHSADHAAELQASMGPASLSTR